MCHGYGCVWESSYWGDCRKPRGEECPMKDGYAENETMRVTHGHKAWDEDDEEECDPAILEDQLERSMYTS